ncbi:MAG: hypothetical protein J0M05_02765 [Candidatus Kapabacteria bacterium]|nr:hypothetical protein [Candidatus Kapabacteria bacterium]
MKNLLIAIILFPLFPVWEMPAQNTIWQPLSSVHTIADAGGRTILIGESFSLKISQDNGRTWAFAPYRFPHLIKKLQCLSDKQWTVLCLSVDGKKFLFHTADAGKHWGTIDVPSLQSAADSNNAVWSIVGRELKKYDGQNWVPYAQISLNDTAKSLIIHRQYCYILSLKGIYKFHTFNSTDSNFFAFPKEGNSLFARIKKWENGVVTEFGDNPFQTSSILLHNDKVNNWKYIPLSKTYDCVSPAENNKLLLANFGLSSQKEKITIYDTQSGDENFADFKDLNNHYIANSPAFSSNIHHIFRSTEESYTIIGSNNLIVNSADSGKTWFLLSYLPSQTKDQLGVKDSPNKNNILLKGSVYAGLTNNMTLPFVKSIEDTTTDGNIRVKYAHDIAELENGRFAVSEINTNPINKIWIMDTLSRKLLTSSLRTWARPLLYSNGKKFLAAISINNETFRSSILSWSHRSGFTNDGDIELPNFIVNSIKGIEDSIIFVSGFKYDSNGQNPSSALYEIRPFIKAVNPIPYDPDTSSYCYIQHIFPDKTLLLSEVIQFTVGRMRRVDLQGRTLYFSKITPEPVYSPEIPKAFLGNNVSMKNDKQGAAVNYENVFLTIDEGRTWNAIDNAMSFNPPIGNPTSVSWTDHGLIVGHTSGTQPNTRSVIYQRSDFPELTITGINEPDESVNIAPLWIFSVNPLPTTENITCKIWVRSSDVWHNMSLKLLSLTAHETDLTNQLPRSFPGTNVDLRITLPSSLSVGVYLLVLSNSDFQHSIPIVIGSLGN